MACAAPGRAKTFIPWAKGKTKATDARLAQLAASMVRFYQEHPEARQIGPKSPRFGVEVSAETRQRQRDAVRPPINERQQAALAAARLWCKGKTAAEDPRIAARAKKTSAALTAFFDLHPERHPRFTVAQKGHETDLERTMRIALSAAGLPFEREYHIGHRWADFAFPDHGLVVEVDGSYWHDAERDKQRDIELQALGWRTLRFDETAVMKHIDLCIRRICEELKVPNTLPQPARQTRFSGW